MAWSLSTIAPRRLRGPDVRAEPNAFSKSARCNTKILLINALNPRRHVRYKANAVARALAAQQPYLKRAADACQRSR